jgi:Uma2 family endonuclease
MVDIERERILPEDIIATDVSFEDYLEHHAEHHREWMQGVVVKTVAIIERHDELYSFLRKMLEAYFAFNPIADVRGEPFVMKLPTRGREPDLMVIMKDNPHPRRKTYLDGPADIVIEIVSPGSERTDMGDKFVEYEQGGVGEYWIFDPIRQYVIFNRRNQEGLFILQELDADENYTTPLLPGFKLHMPTLWKKKLPNYFEIGEIIRQNWEAAQKDAEE